jgi:hypothetical protein
MCNSGSQSLVSNLQLVGTTRQEQLRRAEEDVEAMQKRVESIMAELIPKSAVATRIQDELHALIATGAAAVIDVDLKELIEKRKNETEGLKEKMEEAARAEYEAMRSELAEERRELDNKVARAEEDQKRLERVVAEERIHKDGRVSQTMSPVGEDDDSSGVIVA